MSCSNSAILTVERKQDETAGKLSSSLWHTARTWPTPCKGPTTGAASGRASLTSEHTQGKPGKTARARPDRRDAAPAASPRDSRSVVSRAKRRWAARHDRARAGLREKARAGCRRLARRERRTQVLPTVQSDPPGRREDSAQDRAPQGPTFAGSFRRRGEAGAAAKRRGRQSHDLSSRRLRQASCIKCASLGRRRKRTLLGYPWG